MGSLSISFPSLPLQNVTCTDQFFYSIPVVNDTDNVMPNVNLSHSINSTDKPVVDNQNSSSAYCVEFRSKLSGARDFSCDIDQVCSTDGVIDPICYKGTLGAIRCCQTDLCNLPKIQAPNHHTSTKCWSGGNRDEIVLVDCGSSRCVNATATNSDGEIVDSEYGCDKENRCFGVSLDTECQMTTRNGTQETVCLCSADACNHDNSLAIVTTTVSSTFLMLSTLDTQMYTNGRKRHWTVLVGVLSCVFVGLAVFTVVSLIVKRHRDRRKNVTSSSYTYTQLATDRTVNAQTDSGQEADQNSSVDDEYMLIG